MTFVNETAVIGTDLPAATTPSVRITPVKVGNLISGAHPM
ncbi:hypothetical protein HNP02_001488 [Mycobacterium sp. AZCC_0083]|nr:hypothetical protein [Mycobacterium sp. AZCC_0083]